ncbi:MAG: hypothetical protein R3Y22_03985 [Bacteroidales bacterium]
MPFIILMALSFIGVKWVDIPWYEMDAYGPPFKVNLCAVLIFIILSVINIWIIKCYIFSKWSDKSIGIYMKIFHCIIVIILFKFAMELAFDDWSYWWRIKFVSGEICEYVCNLF